MGICVSYGFVYNSVSISISPSVDLCINRAGAKRRGSNHAVVTALPRNVSVCVLFDARVKECLNAAESAVQTEEG